MALIQVAQALAQLRQSVEPIEATETVALADALGCVLAESQYAAADVPPADHSAMDGYALRCADLQPGRILPVSQRIAAGQPGAPLQPGTAARIFTGAQIPPGADAVALQENAEPGEQGVRLLGSLASGQHIRRRGQDWQKGSELLPAGTRLQPQHLALLAAAGVARVQAYRRLRVGILTTGNELVAPGVALAPGQIHDSNSYLLRALLQQFGVVVEDAGRIKDDLSATVQALRQLATQADLILSCGGVSVGEEDHMRAAVAQLGRIALWRLALKPGKPLAFGKVAGRPFFGLPGNPVSVFVTFLILVRPYLAAMQGQPWPQPSSLYLPAGFARSKASDRQEYLRVRREINAQGEVELVPFASQDSSLLSSIAWADALAVIPAGQSVSRGDLLESLPLSELMN